VEDFQTTSMMVQDSTLGKMEKVIVAPIAETLGTGKVPMQLLRKIVKF
jgi:hypothetical protein